MLEELLHWLGVPGSIVLVVSVLLTLYHGRYLLRFGAIAATWLKFGGVLALLAALAYSGLIPGINLSLNFGALVDIAGDLLRLLPIETLLRWLPL